MGVYHFMGLGRSPGVVTTAISYLANRYQRWDTEDQDFFATSGEIGQTTKPGDVQALVLFTTPEVRIGQTLTFEYIDNKAGDCKGEAKPPAPMWQVLASILKGELKKIGDNRPKIDIYWCDYDRNRPTQTFERVARTLLAAKPPGELGKEVWINLTGGTNVLNSAFELAASLTRVPARMYYVLSESDKCVRWSKETQWIELPIVNMALSRAHLNILLMLPYEAPGMEVSELYGRLKQQQWDDFEDVVSPEQLKLQYLVQLRSQRLIALDETTGRVRVEKRWDTLNRYYEAIPEPVGFGKHESVTLDQLAKQEDWFHRGEDLNLE
jgi:hypothetical protein